eukprot:483569-Pelagomonas_calceolata.AAC.8
MQPRVSNYSITCDCNAVHNQISRSAFVLTPQVGHHTSELRMARAGKRYANAVCSWIAGCFVYFLTTGGPSYCLRDTISGAA